VHDAVIGCDGIKSKVREFVAPECTPSFAHKYCHRGVIPMDKAVEVLGEELAMNNQIYLGSHGHCASMPIEHGKFVSCKFHSPPYQHPS
jgi:salicylate hydroxylase